MRTLIAAVALVAMLAAPASALQIADVQWGFDGHVVPDRVNLLTLRLVNETGVPFKGTVHLIKIEGAATYVGAPQAQEVFLTPGGTRWIQFYTWNNRSEESWRLSWGDRIGRFSAGEDLQKQPKFGPPARVLLNEPGSLLASRARVITFPEDIFPVTVSATDGLWSVIMDHPPRWEPARREAFLDWLHRGGIVHVIYGPDGRFPIFAGDMAFLNQDKDRYPVGSGRVLRHKLRRDDLTEDALVDAGCRGLSLESSQSGYGGIRPEEIFFTSVKSFTRAEHPWGIIFTIVVAYFIVVGPVNFLLARRWRDWRRTTILHVSVVVAACVLLAWLGRRGLGETAAVNSFAYARPVAPGVYDVTQYVNAFAVSGGTYTFQYPSPKDMTPHSIFASCVDEEAVKGVIRNGPEGTFEADMPLYSERPWVWRGKMKGPDLGLEVESWPNVEDPRGLSIRCGGGFPEDIMQAWAVVGAKLQPLVKQSGRLVAEQSNEDFTNISSDLDENRRNLRYNSYSHGDEERKTNPAEEYGKMVRPLMGWAVGGTGAYRYRIIRASKVEEAGKAVERQEPTVDTHALSGDNPGDSIDLFVAARCPEGFRLLRNPFGREMGYVVYHVRLLKP